MTNICDNEYVGSVITAIKDETNRKIFRIQGCNLNGLQVKKRGGDFNEFFNDSEKYNVDMSCLYEINLDTTRFSVKNLLH